MDPVDSSLFSVEWGEQRPLLPAHIAVAPPEAPRSTSDRRSEALRGASGDYPGRPAGGSGAAWEEPGARGSTVWGAKLGSL